MDELRAPAILDEVQATPETLACFRTRIDAAPRRPGQWILAGSQDAPLMHGVTELLAGRATASRTLVPRMGAALDRLSAAVKRYRLSRFLVYRPQGEAARLSALRPRVQAGDLERLLTLIGR